MSKVRAMLLAAAMAVGAATPAFAVGNFQEFTINETSIPGANVLNAANSALVADKFNGGFTEYVTFTSGTTFSAMAYAQFGQYFANDGTALVSSLLNSLEAFGGYRIYALFSASGTYSGLNFTGSAAQFDLYVDPLSNSTFVGTDGLTAITVNGSADDYKIASSNTLVGSGVGTLTAAPGAYNFNFGNFTLTDTGTSQDGTSFFIAPSPFHVVVQVNGDNDQAPITGATIKVTGDVSAVFPVPEPGSLALLGLGLAGLGFAARRRKA